jgi:hypothetical protein
MVQKDPEGIHFLPTHTLSQAIAAHRLVPQAMSTAVSSNSCFSSVQRPAFVVEDVANDLDESR